LWHASKREQYNNTTQVSTYIKCLRQVFKVLTIPTPALSVSGIKGKNSQQYRSVLTTALYCTPWFVPHTNNFFTNVQEIVIIHDHVFA
jgi:hypothetical protein